MRNKVKNIGWLVCIAFLYETATSQDLPVISEDFISVQCSDCELYGLITMPDSDSIDHVNTVVLFFSGRGPTDRDGNQVMMRTNSLRLLAYELAARNIASVRFDKRGVGASRAQPIPVEDIRMEHYIGDAMAWIKKLRQDKRFSRIILLGHGEGSLIALCAAADNKNVHGVISIGGIGRTFDQVLKDEYSDQPFKIREIAYDIIETLHEGQIVERVPVYLSANFNLSIQPFIISSMQYNPQAEARKLKVPFMVVQGEQDVEVVREDARLLAAAHGHAKLVTIPEMNHVMKVCRNDMEQIQTYANPIFPLNADFVEEVAKFIKTGK